MSDQLTQQNAQLAAGVLVDYLRQDEERESETQELRKSVALLKKSREELIEDNHKWREHCAKNESRIELLEADNTNLRSGLKNTDELLADARIASAAKDRENAELQRERDDWRDRCREHSIRNFEASDELSELRDELDDELSEKELAQAEANRKTSQLRQQSASYAICDQERQCAEAEVADLKAELSRLKSSSRWAVTCEGMTKESAERYAGLMREYLYQGRDNWRAVPFAAKEGGPWVLVRRMAYKMPGTTAASGSPVKAAIYETYEVAKRNNNGDFIPVRLSDVKEDTNAE